MIRTLGFNGQFGTRNGLDQLHTASGTLNLSDNTQKYVHSAWNRKSIFFLKQDELSLRCIFSDLNNKMANHQVVSRKDILTRINDPRFSHVIKRMKNVFFRLYLSKNLYEGSYCW